MKISGLIKALKQFDENHEVHLIGKLEAEKLPATVYSDYLTGTKDFYFYAVEDDNQNTIIYLQDDSNEDEALFI